MVQFVTYGLRVPPAMITPRHKDAMSGGSSTVVSGRRHEARITALQALFEIDTATHGTDEVLARYLGSSQMPPATRQFIESLVRGVGNECSRLDAIIAKNAPAWPVPQLPAIDRTILRMALWELLIERDVPVKAVINEAVELAKRFGGDNSGRFVNGVLGTVVTEQRPESE
jgi:N utilization substance protein B